MSCSWSGTTAIIRKSQGQESGVKLQVQGHGEKPTSEAKSSGVTLQVWDK